MINVLHLRDTNKVCGPGKTVMETACRINQDRFNLSVGLFFRHPDDTNLYREALEARGVEVVPLVSESKFSRAMIKNTIEVIKRQNIHIIHSHDYKTDILTAIISRYVDIPIMTTAHGWITNHLKSKIYTWAGKKSFKYFDKVIAVSPKIRAEVARHGVSDDKLVLIYNAIVAENYQPGEHSPGYLRTRFGIPADHKIIGNIGRISPEKGQLDFIKAAAILLEQRQDLSFVLTGDGPDKARAENLVKQLGIENAVHFTGHEKDVRPIFRDMDLFALTSYTEGFPNVVLESLCMDVPVLATDVGGTGDIITDQETGILIPSGQPDQIAAGLNFLLDNPQTAKQLTRAGKDKLMKYYEFAIRVNKIENLYEQVLEQHTRGQAK